MTYNSFIKWASMSDKALAEHIGAFIRQHRVEQNKTQDTLAEQAGISRSTLSLLERGESVNLATFIQVLRVLDQLQVMDVFTIQDNISPLLLVKRAKEKRKRASGKNADSPKKSGW